MTERVQQILSNYAGESAGVLTNLARLLNHGTLAGTGRLVILPVDQGVEHGPARSFASNPSGYNPEYLFELAGEAGCSAYAAPLGSLEAGAAKFAGEVAADPQAQQQHLAVQGPGSDLGADRKRR